MIIILIFSKNIGGKNKKLILCILFLENEKKYGILL